MSRDDNPLRPTGPIRPGDPDAVVILPERNDPPPEGGNGSRVVCSGLSIALRADVLVDGMSRAVLTHTREAILAGQRPDGGGPQAKLGARAAAIPGRLTPHRGARTGTLADGLKRTAITGSTSSASTRIEPPGERVVYVRKEATLGRELITARGAASEAAERAAASIVADMAAGQGFATDRAEREADDV
jgi:hypothetical protein